MILAEVSFMPLGMGESVSEYVIQALRTFKAMNVKYTPNSMGTVIEADSLEVIFSVVKEAEKTIMAMGVKRLDTFVKIDHRVDKENSAEIKMKKISEAT